MGNTLLNQENIRRELLELTQQTASKAINDTDNTIAKFLKGEIELSIDKINELKTDFYNNWIKEKELTPRQKRQLERYSLKEYFDLPDDEWDEKVEQLLRDSTERKRDFQPLMNIAEDGKEALGKQWNKDDIFKFTNGTSETRARMFLSEGKGFTSLESPAYVPGEKYLSRTGLQIAPYGTGIGERSYDYARMQSSRFKDRPVIIEGEIPAQYVYRNTNGSAEFGIPHQYYDKISSAKILDAETMQELYHLDNGKLVKSETFTEPKLPELKIKELNKSVIQQSKPKTNKEKLDDMFINSKQYNVWNKRKEELIKEGIDIKDTPDFYFGFDTESGKLYKDLLLKKNNQTVLGFINKDKDSMFVVAHGTKKGKIHVGKNNQMTIEQLGEYLQENNLIPDGIKNIYTVDCYGGLQKPVQLKNGIIIQSSHTSDKPIFSKLANEKLTFLGLQGDAEIIPEVQKFQGQKLSLAFDTDTFHNARLKLNTDSNGQYYFGDIQPEESIKVNEEVSIKNTDNNIKGQISFIDDNGNIKQEYKLTPQEAFDINQYFSTQKIIHQMEDYIYDIDSREFIDSKLKRNDFTKEEYLEYKKAKKRWNKYSKTEQQISAIYEDFLDYMNEFYEQLSKDAKNALFGDWDKKYNFTDEIMESALEQRKYVFQKWAKDNNLDFESINDYLMHLHKQEGQKNILTPQEAFDKYGPNDDRFYTSQGLNPKEQKEKINELNSKRKSVKTDKEILDDISIKPEEYDKVENNFKDIANELENLKNTTEEIVEETTENIQKELPKKQLTKASSEAIENNVKNINFKKVGKIGAIIGTIGLVSYGIGKHNENKKEEKQQIQYPQNNNYIDNSYAQQMASDISSYRYGKQMTGFIN